MKLFSRLVPLFIIGIVAMAFFYKSIFFGHIPFPGDLLISEYKPWRTYSYIGFNPGSFPSKAQYPDTIRQLYPWKTLVIDQLKEKFIPLWNPYNFSGTPLLGNFQSSPLYPFNVLYFIFSQTTAWTLLILLQPFLAIVFTYYYCRKINLSKEAALLAAISFGFSSFFSVWLEYNTVLHVVLWLPLVLLSLEHLFDKLRASWVIIFLFSIVSALFAGHPQIFVYVLLFSTCYVLVRSKSGKKTVFMIAIMMLGISVGAVQLLPGLELIAQSARSSHTWEMLTQKILIQPWQCIMFFVPDFFGNPATRNYWLGDTYIGKVTSIGIVPIFFILSLATTIHRHSLTKFYLGTAIMVFFLVTVNPVSLLFYKLNIPFLSTSSPTLMTFLFHFSLAMLAGFGLEAWRQKKLTLRQFFKITLPLILLFLLLWLSVFFLPKFIQSTWASNLIIARRNLFYSTCILSASFLLLFFTIKKPKIFSLLIILLLCLHSVDLWMSFKKFNPFVPKDLVFPKTEIFDELKRISGINRFWGYGTAAIEANFATQYQLFVPDGYDPLYPRRYGEFIGSSYNGKIQTSFTTQTRSDAVIAPGYGEKDMPSNLYRLRVLDVLGVKYILDRAENGSTGDTFPPQRFSQMYNKDGWRILENHNASPRIFLSSSYQIFSNTEEFEKIFFDKDFNPTQSILLEESLPEKLQQAIRLDTIELQTYKPNQVKIKTVTDGNRLLFLSDTYFPGWKAYIDERETKIYRADWTFRAIFIPKGEHTIRFIYNPSSFRIGILISLGGIIFALIGIGTLFLKKNYDT